MKRVMITRSRRIIDIFIELKLLMTMPCMPAMTMAMKNAIVTMVVSDDGEHGHSNSCSLDILLIIAIIITAPHH